jgi:hypothetical protein
MHAKSSKFKLIAIFLVAFVCLNAGGAVCVAYCQTAMETLSASQDHCPLKKKASHCDPDVVENGFPTAESAGNGQIDCCAMTVSFIAAPIEKRFFSFEPAAALVSLKVRTGFPSAFESAGLASPPPYRGPPLDRRADRIKHRIIRI